MKKYWLGLVGGLSVLLACATDTDVTGPRFLRSDHWDRGKAQVDVYDADYLKYGVRRKGRLTLVLVKEPFNLKTGVKEKGAGAAVLKMNLIRRFNTGIYDYYQMGSAFVDVRNGRLAKFAGSSQDGCGMTYKVYADGGLRTFSYFDGEGEKHDRLDLKGKTFYYMLPLILRYRLRQGERYALPFYRTMMSNRYVKPRVFRGKVRVDRLKTYQPGDKRYEGVFRVTVTYGEGKDRLHFAAAFPHTMLSWHKANGDRLMLRRSHFIDYWNYNRPEHQSLLGPDNAR